MSLIRLALACTLVAAALLAASLPSPTAVARDASGFLYLAGTSYTDDLPTTPGVLQPTAPLGCRSDPFRSLCAPFLVKLAPDGAIVWATYLAGNGADQIAAIALAPNGDLIVAGNTTSTNLLPDRQGYRSLPASLYLARVTPDGASITAATYFGGTDSDTIQALALDAAGNIYIAGVASSATFPTTPGAYRTSGVPAPFIAKFDGTLHQLLVSTLVAYAILDSPSDLVLLGPIAFAVGPDTSLYIVVTGPPGLGSPGPMPITVARLTADGSKAVYSTTFTSYLVAGAIAVDTGGNAYVATYQRRYTVQLRSNILKLSPSGQSLWTSDVDGANINSLIFDGQHELVFSGLALDLLFAPTAGAPRACLDTGQFRPVTTYAARFDTSSRSFNYAGYLNAAHAWLTADPHLLVAESAYVGLPRFATLPASIPQAGTITCVANAASHDKVSTAPGEILSIYGTEIGPAQPLTAQFDTDGNVTKSLGGITVTFDGIPSPILYAAPGQINLVVPFSISPDTVHIELRRNGTVLLAFDRAVTATHPAFFTANGLRSGPLAALNQDGTVNSADNPASPGSIVSIFATGLGRMTPAAIDGAVPQAPLSYPIAPFTFTLFITLAGSFVPEIDYLGNAPGMVQGAIQINFRLPLSTPPDGVEAAFTRSNGGTIWVR